MKHKPVCKVLVLLSTLFAFTTSAQISEKDVIFKALSDVEIQAVAKYWTQERINEAEPLPLPRPKMSAEAKNLMADIDKEGESKFIAPVIGPETANVDENPFNVSGKLFFKTPQEQHFHCTAEFVGSGQVLMTAAHCVHSPYYAKNEFNSDFIFLRAFNDGSGERFNVKCFVIWPQWVLKSGNPRLKWDYAFLYTQEAYDNWLGLAAQPQSSIWTAIGYPNNYGDAKAMYRVTGTKGIVQPYDTVQMLNNPMREGSSGGAWIDNLAYPFAIGLNSYYNLPQGQNMYSPVFDNNTVRLNAFVHDWGCTK